MRNIDELLTDALKPDVVMSPNLKKNIILKAATKQKDDRISQPDFHRIRIAAFCGILLILAAAAFTLWKLRSSQEVAERLEDQKLAEAFDSERAWNIQETQHIAGYDVTLLGLVSGQEITDYPITYNGDVIENGTYAAVAIQKSDGNPMESVSLNESFLISPYIEGLNPAFYNIFTFGNGGYSAFVENGVQYRLVHMMGDIEPFADRTIYLGVSDGTFYNAQAFNFDPESGKISRNEDYDGLNALFVLPYNPEKADPEKAAEIIERMEKPGTKNSDAEITGGIELPFERISDVEAFMNILTPENIDAFAIPVESTRQTTFPDANGMIQYSWEMPDEGSGSGSILMNLLFPDEAYGMSEEFFWSVSDEGFESLRIGTFTLNQDSSVTFLLYIPKSGE